MRLLVINKTNGYSASITWYRKINFFQNNMIDSLISSLIIIIYDLCHYSLYFSFGINFISQDNNVYGWGGGWGYLMTESNPTHFTNFLTEVSIGPIFSVHSIELRKSMKHGPQRNNRPTEQNSKCGSASNLPFHTCLMLKI